MSTRGINIRINGIEEKLNALASRSQNAKGYLNRVVYKQYQKAQKERWETEGESEGPKWKPLSTRPFIAWWEKDMNAYYAAQEGGYALYKKYKFASYPGRGQKMLVATNKLVKSVIGPGDGHRKVVTKNKLLVATTVPYAKYVDEARSFTTWSKKTMNEIKSGLVGYLTGGVK